MTDKSEKLTPEQIKNWRNVLFGMIGSYALIMPEEDIEAFRARMQHEADKDGQEEQSKTVDQDAS